jgi:hypothetical protein
MTVLESEVNNALVSEDIESLIEAGAPDDEYSCEARGVVTALAMIDDSEISKETVAEMIRSVWSRSFGPFYEEDLDLRMPAFHNVARQILASDTRSSE